MEGRKGGRRGAEGEGVASDVSTSPEQGRRAQGERWSAAADRIGRERERQREREPRAAVARWGK